jgi:hypothetical protein
MVQSALDATLLKTLSGARVDTVADVIACMREVDDVLPPDDGLKWFNILYLMVTEEIERDLVAHRWADEEWLHRLDVEFARLYFEAIALWLVDPLTCPRAWTPLFERRFHPGIARVQFGMAGMNAHINRDLSLAVVRTCEGCGITPRRGTPQHADFDRVNKILEEVEIRAMKRMATGLLGQVATQLGRAAEVVAMWNVRTARDAAWLNGEVLWTLRPLPDLGHHYLGVLDRMTGFASRGLLVRTEPFEGSALADPRPDQPRRITLAREPAGTPLASLQPRVAAAAIRPRM